MTCVVGLRDNGRILLGGDRKVMYGNDFGMTLDFAKIFKRGEFLIGTAGMCKELCEIKYNFSPPPIRTKILKYG